MSQTSDRYAAALFELAGEGKNLQPVQDAMTALHQLIIDAPDFRLFLSNPLLSYEERCGVLKALFETRVPELLYRFLLFITYKERLAMLGDMIESFDSLYLTFSRQMRVTVKTALGLNDKEKALIDEHLQKKFQQKTITQWDLDPGLIGGFRIFAQGKLYDYSFKNQLDHFLYQSVQPV